MSKNIQFDKTELDHAVKSFGYPNYEKRIGMVRGKNEFNPHALSEEEQSAMKQLLANSGRADDVLILNKKK